MNHPEQTSEKRASAWIISPVLDLTLLIATPLAIIPVLWLLARYAFSPEQIALAVLAFASLGHHLPGFMRAYGDRELFLRYRWRFLLAPPLVFAASWISFVWLELHGLEIILLFWATWHILMQTYGFMRIYDAKHQSQSEGNGWLEFWACVAVFTAGIVFSDARMFGIVETLSLIGLPVMKHASLEVLRWIVGIGTVIVLTALIVRSLSSWRRPASVNWLKLLLLLCTASLYWTAGQLAVNLLIGVAMFEVFHAIQYYAIVWFYNRQRANRVGDDFGPLGSLFRGRWWGLPVFALAIVAFGSLSFFGRSGDSPFAAKIAMALFSASAMLHFYYDGFIWKVRENKTRQNLNITNAVEEVAKPWPLKHVLQWSALSIVLLFLGMSEYRARTGSPGNEQRRLRTLAALTPNLPELQTRMSRWSLLDGDAKAAFDTAEKAVRLRPRSYTAQFALGNAAVSLTKWNSAHHAFTIATNLRPTSVEAHYGLGVANFQQGNYEASRHSLQNCLDLQANHVQAHFQLGNMYYFTKQPARAIASYQRCTELQSDFVDAYNNLGAVLFDTNDLRNAADAYRKALQLRPNNAATHYNLGLVLLFQGKRTEARHSILRAQQLGQPLSPEVARDLDL